MEKITSNELKDILQLYESIERLVAIDKNINNNNNYQKIKNSISLLENEGNQEKKIEEIRKCLIDLINIQEENTKNIQIFHETLRKIINVYEKALYSEDK